MKTDKLSKYFTRRQFPDHGKQESAEKRDGGSAPKAEFMSRLGAMLFNHQRFQRIFCPRNTTRKFYGVIIP